MKYTSVMAAKKMLEEKYPIGTKVKLKSMKDEPMNDKMVGAIGIVEGYDDEPGLMMKWDNGSSLKLYPFDDFEIIKEEPAILIKTTGLYCTNSKHF